MLIIASSAPVNAHVRLSTTEETSLIPKDTAIIKIRRAVIKEEGKKTTADIYILVSEEIKELLTYENIISIKNYKLERICSHNNCIVFKTAYDQNSDTSMVVNKEVYLNLDNDCSITAHLTDKWLLRYNKGEINFKNKEILVNLEEIEPEYEGTPVACVRWAIPNIIRRPYISSDNCHANDPDAHQRANSSSEIRYCPGLIEEVEKELGLLS